MPRAGTAPLLRPSLAEETEAEEEAQSGRDQQALLEALGIEVDDFEMAARNQRALISRCWARLVEEGLDSPAALGLASEADLLEAGLEPEEAQSLALLASDWSARAAREDRAAGMSPRRACSCRCTPAVSGIFVLATMAAVAGVAPAMHAIVGSRPGWGVPPPPPPEPPRKCGTWPYDMPCSSCIYGSVYDGNCEAEVGGLPPRHRVGPGDTCSTIAKKYGVPQFDLFNRNKSRPCCHVDCGPFGDKCAVDTVIAATDIIDICCPPTIEQWNRAGHPQRVPDKIVATFIGATPSGIRAPLALPEAINVGYLFETSDNNGHTGEFTVGKQFTDGSSTVCAAQVDPTQPHRGPSADSPDGRRLWTFSWGTSSGRWSGSHPEEWAEGAAVSHHPILSPPPFLIWRGRGSSRRWRRSSCATASTASTSTSRQPRGPTSRASCA